MTTKGILNLDYRKKENISKIQKVLLKIKPLMKYSDEEQIPFEVLEKLVHIFCNNYKVWVRRIMQSPTTSDDGDVWSCQVVDTDNIDVIQEIYGICMYEIFAKLVIFLWSAKEKGKIKRRIKK